MLQSLGGEAYRISAGGSLSNTLMGLSQLSSASEAVWGGAPLHVGMAGLVGADPLGSFYCAALRNVGVEVVAKQLEGANTGAQGSKQIQRHC